MVTNATIEPCCSVRLLQPFLRWAATQERHRSLVPDEFWGAPADARVSVERVHDMLEAGSENAGDDQLGLRLGHSMSLGAGGAFDYAVRSAATFGASIATAGRYTRLVADSFRISLERWKTSAVIRLDSDVTWPRAAGDFAAVAVHKLHVADHVPAERLEAWFPYAAPRVTGEHQRSFPGVTLRFGAPFYGFAFPLAYADVPLTGADPGLHSLLVHRADAMLAELSAAPPLSAVVRRLIATELPSGVPTADRIARSVRMSRRTMARRLEHEHTTFDAELDAVRRRIAIDAVSSSQMPLAEIAYLAGFSHVESFYRAFRRWTDMTPLAYRTSHRA